jgi:uncharacterized membrane protein YdbT with pleckstrin-like domain
MELQVFTIKPSLKYYAGYLIFLAWLLCCVLYIRFILPKSGIYVFQIYDVTNHMLRPHLLKLLEYKISYDFLCYCTYGVMLVIMNIALTLWAKIKFTSYTFNNKNIDLRQGVFDQEQDAIDVSDIKDFKFHRSVSDLSLGLAQLRIWSKGITEPLLEIKGLHKDDAQKAYDHLKKYTMHNYTDYRIAQDIENGEKNQPKSDSPENKGPGPDDVA